MFVLCLSRFKGILRMFVLGRLEFKGVPRNLCRLAYTVELVFHRANSNLFIVSYREQDG